MKFKLFVFTLALALATWAQTQNATPQTNPSDATKGACCEKMAGHSDAKGCCHMSKKDGKGMACCTGKQACCNGAQCTRSQADPQAKANPQSKSDDKSTAATDKPCCGEKCCAEGKNCCGSAKGTQTAMACCGDQCPMHAHAAADQAK